MPLPLDAETKKKLLGFLRGGDFAHPGEAQAIDLIFGDLPHNPNRLILEVGCGIGGTADYIQRKGYGRVIAIDRDKKVIEVAQQRYPDVTFIHLDVLHVGEYFKSRNLQFNIVCLINSFCFFTDQAEALRQIRQITDADAIIKLFEYTDLTLGRERPVLHGNHEEQYFAPVRSDQVAELFLAAEFHMGRFVALDSEFTTWYRDLCEKICRNKQQIIEFFSQEAYQWAHEIYTRLLQSILDKKIGCCLLEASTAPKLVNTCRLSRL